MILGQGVQWPLQDTAIDLRCLFLNSFSSYLLRTLENPIATVATQVIKVLDCCIMKKGSHIGHKRNEYVCLGGDPDPPKYGTEAGVIVIEDIYMRSPQRRGRVKDVPGNAWTVLWQLSNSKVLRAHCCSSAASVHK